MPAPTNTMAAGPGHLDPRGVALGFQRAVPRAALGQIATTLLPLVALLAAMHGASAAGWWWLVPALALPAAALTVRAFIIQHDCGHGSFLPARRANDALGRFCSLLTFTPYANWRRQHAQHHGSWNDLDRREGRGSDIYSTCLTVSEYRALGPWKRRWHRSLRHPVVAVLLLPPVIFLVLHRLPRVLQWLTGNIGFHHVHHLAPRIPNYRLEACHRAHPAFADVRALTLSEGLVASLYALWDDDAGRMVTFGSVAKRARTASGP